MPRKGHPKWRLGSPHPGWKKGMSATWTTWAMGLGLSNDGLSLSLLFRMFAACKSQLSSAETQSGWTEKWCEGGSSTNRNPLPFLVYPEPHFGKYFGWLLHSVAIECCIEVYIYIYNQKTQPKSLHSHRFLQFQLMVKFNQGALLKQRLYIFGMLLRQSKSSSTKRSLHQRDNSVSNPSDSCQWVRNLPAKPLWIPL